MEKKLHEKTIGELRESLIKEVELDHPKGNFKMVFESTDVGCMNPECDACTGTNFCLSWIKVTLKQWAIACVKEYQSKIGDIEISIHPNIKEKNRTIFMNHTERKLSPQEHHCISLITFLIEKFEITKEELK